MVNKLIVSNILHRPLRTAVSAFAVAIEVAMVIKESYSVSSHSKIVRFFRHAMSPLRGTRWTRVIAYRFISKSTVA